jgi:hypothetical protein
MIEYGESNLSGGCCLLEYGATGCGKTDSAKTLPDPVMFINKEPKDPRVVHQAKRENGLYALPNGKHIRYVEPEGFDDEMEFLNKCIEEARTGSFPFRSVFHDGLTFTQANYKHDVEDSRAEARSFDAQKSQGKERDRGLIDRFRFEKPDWGAMGSMMARETFLLNKLSKFGIVVVSTAVEMEYPKWNSSIRVAPSLQGQDFPKLIHGYFDFIGYVIQPFRIVAGVIQYPRISFVSNDDSMGNGYMARCNSSRLIEAELQGGAPPLDFEKILKVIRG